MKFKTIMKAMAFVAVVLCSVLVTSCSKVETKEITRYICYRQAKVTKATYIKDGKTYSTIRFFVVEISSAEKICKYEVYNEDAVSYYGLTGLSLLTGSSWRYDANAVQTIEIKTESGKFTLSDGTVLYWETNDEGLIEALKDENGVVQYVGWKYDDSL